MRKNLSYSTNGEVEVTVQKALYREYAFTLRKCKSPSKMTEELLLEHLEKMCNKTSSSLIDYVFEKEGGLHMHGIIQVPKKEGLYHFRCRGWHMHLEELYNEAGWRYYMMKAQRLEEGDGVILRKKLFPELTNKPLALGTQNTEEDYEEPARAVSATK